ncbi:transcription factor CBF [Phycomyces blakesleeanus]|uniref:Transcription factor CBF n=2 Tax=Phycomyces blakesleeanus TaxID=4837 RepID=A0A167JX98_PHYB8|nr:transcription factor CBF [Phycomyces blakesleeanus NRRL 1555(-)]OAD66856.1 transcription factor CBF [Phycomyces blakesleeanus NRRL 1555(-)]|eukprot:XP_018284896.1 transcription factor CBF [Phycomyces blakesleeanus NRRL 1555(-)]
MKKKYKTKFPVARIKKIMQLDEDVGKVAQATPILISKALELFMQSLIDQACQETRTRNAKRLSAAHLKKTIETVEQFDFLKEVVANVPDPSAMTTAPLVASDTAVTPMEDVKEEAVTRPSRSRKAKTAAKVKQEAKEEEDEEDE